MQLFLFFLYCLLIRLSNATTSFTVNGEWAPAPADECSRYMCTPNNLTFISSAPNKLKLFDNVSACDALVKKGVKKIYFHGDSYMRQMYAAMLISLNGDYRYGSLANPALSPQCEYHRQFYEKSCGTRQLNHWGVVCGGQIIMDPMLNGFSNVNHCSGETGSIVLWSFANYPLGHHGRHGVNNATVYQEFFERDICPTLRSNVEAYPGDTSHPCSVWWISTHYRVRAYFEDEKPDIVKNYNEQMRLYFDTKRCGAVNYIDVYNMTARLATGHPTEAEKMTYDGVHWGFEGNLVKAQIIINALTA